MNLAHLAAYVYFRSLTQFKGNIHEKSSFSINHHFWFSIN